MASFTPVGLFNSAAPDRLRMAGVDG